MTFSKFKANIGFIWDNFSISNDSSFTNFSLTSIVINGFSLIVIEALVISFSDTVSLFNKSKTLSLNSFNVVCVFT